MYYASIDYLDDRAVLQLSGPDAGAFLQGLITNDMELLQSQKAIFAGLLAPQGKLLFEFFVVKNGDGFVLELTNGAVADLAKRLAVYKLRAKIQIEDVSARFTPMMLWGENIQSPGETSVTVAFTDPRHPRLGRRILAEAQFGVENASATAGSYGPAHNYDTHRISLGVPEGGKDYAFGELFPHEAMFDQLNGVSFTKGCYVGQEIVSRMQHRGTARSRFLIVDAQAPLPPVGTPVQAGEAPIGQMGSNAGKQGLALVRLDRLTDAYATKTPITAGGIPIRLTKPAYASFEVPTP